jgi:hypothetical protein
MADKNGLAFLGRVPIDTVLVGLLDAVSKGEIPGAAINGTGEDGRESEQVIATGGFPLLDKYLETTSSKVWKGIAEGVVTAIDRRRAGVLERLKTSE